VPPCAKRARQRSASARTVGSSSAQGLGVGVDDLPTHKKFLAARRAAYSVAQSLR